MQATRKRLLVVLGIAATIVIVAAVAYGLQVHRQFSNLALPESPPRMDSVTSRPTRTPTPVLSKSDAESQAGMFPEGLYQDTSPRDDAVFPRKPSAVYSEYINAADKGDPWAMYWVSKALKECSYTASTKDELQHQILDRAEFQPLWDQYTALYEWCEDLFERLPGVNVGARAKYWLEQSALAGNKTARAELLLDGARAALNQTPELEVQIKELVEAAVQTDGYPAYFLMQRYLDLRENKGATPTTLAWGYEACRLSPACDSQKRIEELHWELDPAGVDQVLAVAKQIEHGAVPQ